MNQGLKTFIVPVRDLAKAKTLYGTLLGAAPYVDAPYYVGFRVGEQELGLDPNGHKQGVTGPIAYWEVADIRASRQALMDAGAQSIQDVKDVGGGRLIATLRDVDGNVIGLLQNP